MSVTFTLRFIGFSTGSTGTSPDRIAAGLRLQAGRAEVRESGVYRSEIAVNTGDILRITVGGGSVKYSKNGTVFYTSTSQPAYPLVINTSLLDLGATIKNATIGQATATVSSTARTPPYRRQRRRVKSHIGLQEEIGTGWRLGWRLGLAEHEPPSAQPCQPPASSPPT